MQGLTVAVLAMAAAAVNARTVILNAKAAFHTDQWCADHHLGEGPSTCIQHSGCCYDGRIGICHSCDAHSDEWCDTYGGNDVKTCVGYSGCTYDFNQGPEGKCVSNSDPDSIVDEITCEEAYNKAIDEDGISALNFGEGQVDNGSIDSGSMITYTPQCTADGTWEEIQYDEASDFKWCVDENGHEIPNTRRQSKFFASDLINCNKERKQHAGMQCPNAVTLTTGNGEVMINDHDDVGNCDITCNTDQDCKGNDWCCYNGCGYSCQTPITPKADCAHLVLDASLKPSDSMTKGHGTVVTIGCNNGYFGSDAIEIECKHGSWSDYDMECLKDCEDYKVPMPLRMRDYDIKGGKNLHHGGKVRVSCTKGYGAVFGSPEAMRFWKETLHCVNGAWNVVKQERDEDGNQKVVAHMGEQTLVCSACYDADSLGPNAWWEGIEDGTERAESKDCQYFASRPLECANSRGARDNCRISCRTCEEALMEYKVKATSMFRGNSMVYAAKNPEKWLAKKLRVLKGFRPKYTEERRTKVARRVKKEPKNDVQTF